MALLEDSQVLDKVVIALNDGDDIDNRLILQRIVSLTMRQHILWRNRIASVVIITALFAL